MVLMEASAEKRERSNGSYETNIFTIVDLYIYNFKCLFCIEICCEMYKFLGLFVCRKSPTLRNEKMG